MFCVPGKLTERALEREAAAATPVHAVPVQHSLLDMAPDRGAEQKDHGNAAEHKSSRVHIEKTRTAAVDNAAIRSRLSRTAQDILTLHHNKLDGASVPPSPRSNDVRLRLEQKARGLGATSSTTSQISASSASRDTAIRARLLESASVATNYAAREDSEQSRASIRARLLLAAAQKRGK